MVFYRKYKPIPKHAVAELEAKYREIFRKEGTAAADAWAFDAFEAFSGLRLYEYQSNLRVLCNKWGEVFWMDYFPADLRLNPKSTTSFRHLLANQARNMGISFDGGHGQHPRWLIKGEKRNEEANLLMEALAGALEKQIRSVPERFDKDIRWKKMKGVLDFKRRTLLYVLKDQLVIEYHKECDLVKRPLKVVR